MDVINDRYSSVFLSWDAHPYRVLAMLPPGPTLEDQEVPFFLICHTRDAIPRQEAEFQLRLNPLRPAADVHDFVQKGLGGDPSATARLARPPFLDRGEKACRRFLDAEREEHAGARWGIAHILSQAQPLLEHLFPDAQHHRVVPIGFESTLWLDSWLDDRLE